MYTGVVLGGATAVTTTAALTLLPSTGGNLIISVAVSVATGMVAWGVMYARGR